MQHKRTVILAVLASFIVCGTVVAATQRDITTKLGGKANDVFKVVGGLVAKTLELSGNLRVDGSIYRGKVGVGDNKPVVINDNLQVKGGLTVGGVTVGGIKRYSGTFDTSQSGDFVSTMTTLTDCTVPMNSMVTHTTVSHYKTLSIAEIKTSTLPELRLYVKPISLATPSLYSPSYYPNNNDIWSSSSYYLSEGKLYFLYKTVTTLCNGTTSSLVTITGDYQLIVQ